MFGNTFIFDKDNSTGYHLKSKINDLTHFPDALDEGTYNTDTARLSRSIQGVTEPLKYEPFQSRTSGSFNVIGVS